MSYLKNITEYIQQRRILQHIIFWLAVLLFSIPQNFIDQGHTLTRTFVYNLCLLLPQILASYLITYYIILRLLVHKKYLTSVFLLFVSVYVFTALGRIMIVHIGETLVREQPFTQEPIIDILTDIRHLASGYLPAVFSTVLIFVSIKFFTNYKAIKEKELYMLNDKVTSELKTLKAQLNPHFLFNTLNNIYALSIENSPQTSVSIEKLSKILDYVLYRCNTKYVAISSEIELLENYIELEKLRYDDRLKLTFNNNIEMDGEIAPLILLSLVENAFKHGAGEDSGSPEIDISIHNTSHLFTFVISNTIATSTDDTERISIGLENIKKQLDLIYQDKFELILDHKPKIFTVTIKINK